MAVHPLRSATHHRLGGPLPHQLANAPQVHPMVHPERCFQWSEMPLSIVSGISQTFAWVSQSLGQVTYVLLTRSPLEVQVPLDRLACIRHAASVHPEPGSNSQNLFNCFFIFSWLKFFAIFSLLVLFNKLNLIDVVCLFQFYLVFKDQCRAISRFDTAYP